MSLSIISDSNRKKRKHEEVCSNDGDEEETASATNDADEDDFEEQEEETRSVVDSTSVSWKRKKGGIYTLDIQLYESYEDERFCKDISATLKFQNSFSTSVIKEEKIGSFNGHLLSHSRHFFRTADAISGELITLAALFCNSRGELTRGRFSESSTELTRTRAGHESNFSASLKGLKKKGVELLHLESMNILKQHKGQDLGLRVVQELMAFLRGRWNVCLMEIDLFGVNDNDRIDMAEEDGQVVRHDQAILKLSRHYARMGFQQVGRNREESNFWFTTSSFYFQESSSTANSSSLSPREWMSKEESQNIDVFIPAKTHTPMRVDKSLQDLINGVLLDKEQHPSLQDQKFHRVANMIQILVNCQRASIHKSRALFILAANPRCTESSLARSVFEYLLLNHSMADINRPDETGSRPLHIAASETNFSAIQLLVQAGSSLIVTNEKGETPWQTLVAARQRIRDLYDTFSLQSKMREIDPFLKSMSLLLPPSISELLIDGYISPRMRMLLSITAQNIECVLRDYDCTDACFEKYKPTLLSECCSRFGGITQFEYIPTDVFLQNPKGIYKSFADGWHMVWEAIGNILRRNAAPTLTKVRNEIQNGYSGLRGYDLRKWRHFESKGGRIEYALDCLFSVTRNNVLFNDGWVYDDYEDEIEQLPQTPLDDDFDLVRCKCLGITYENLKQQPNGPYNHVFD